MPSTTSHSPSTVRLDFPFNTNFPGFVARSVIGFSGVPVPRKVSRWFSHVASGSSTTSPGSNRLASEAKSPAARMRYDDSALIGEPLATATTNAMKVTGFILKSSGSRHHGLNGYVTDEDNPKAT